MENEQNTRPSAGDTLGQAIDAGFSLASRVQSLRDILVGDKPQPACAEPDPTCLGALGAAQKRGFRTLSEIELAHAAISEIEDAFGMPRGASRQLKGADGKSDATGSYATVGATVGRSIPRAA